MGRLSGNELLGIGAQNRRRSVRVTIDIPVEVAYQGPDNENLVQQARTLNVSAHGAALVVENDVQFGQNVIVIHKRTREEVACRVVSSRLIPKTTNIEVGVEFCKPMPSLWQITFPST